MLEARDLTCGYGGSPVLESLTLAAGPGEVLVLLGPNGAGKSTLLRALARLLRPIQGGVFLDEQNVKELTSGALAQRVGYMPQSEARDWPLTVEQAVSLGRAPHRGWHLPFSAVDRQTVEAALRETGLIDLRHRLITELSGGQWRRVVLARALSQQATVLLLDEPTAGLDIKYQHEMLQITCSLAATRQLTVVLTLHDLQLAALYADRVAVIAMRRVTALGTPHDVLTSELIERVFGIQAAVLRHPVYGTPLVAPLIDRTVDPCGEGRARC